MPDLMPARVQRQQPGAAQLHMQRPGAKRQHLMEAVRRALVERREGDEPDDLWIVVDGALEETARALGFDPEAIYRREAPGVVTVISYFGGEGPARGLGSGFIVDTAGIVVTNNHVIADADEINVIMNDGTKIKAELVGVDKKTDIAVLKFKPVKPLIAVKFGDSAHARVGDWIIAIALINSSGPPA